MRLRRKLTKGGTEELVNEERRLILQLDINTLVQKLRGGELRPTKVLEAYQVFTCADIN